MSKAQTTTAIPAPLKIGQQVPDIYFREIYNTATPGYSLHKIKARLILIDFWATNCGACIQKFPMLDSMQNLYSNELSVLLVSSSKSDTKEKVEKLFTRLKTTDNVTIRLPVILGDTLANKWFPHIYVPHYVWLDSNFHVLAITDGAWVSPQRLAAYIKGEMVSFPDPVNTTGFKNELPLFMNGNAGLGSQLISRSTLSGYIPGLSVSTNITKDSAGKITRLLLTNQPILELVKRAYHYFDFPARIQWPGGRAKTLNPKGKTGEWFIANSYTYELITPAINYDKARLYMQHDIKRYFGYTAELKKLPVKCYVLTADSTVLNVFKTKGGKKFNYLSDNSSRQLQNNNVDALAEFLNNNLELPVLNETSYSAVIDLSLAGISLSDINTIRKALSVYGLYLKEEIRLQNIFFIYHNPN